jgi:hypothetical protein
MYTGNDPQDEDGDGDGEGCLSLGELTANLANYSMSRAASLASHGVFNAPSFLSQIPLPLVPF